MKKIILPLFAFATFCLATTKSSAQAVEQGNVIAEAYYGFPNLYTSVFKGLYANSDLSENVKVGSMGPIGVRGEYLLTDKIGLGLDLGINSSTVSYNETYSVYNNVTEKEEDVVYDYKFKTQKVGAIITFNYHFIEADAFDMYFVAGMGYGSRSFTYTSTDPSYTLPSTKSLIPVASRIGVGMRYFFTENIGANLALGFGQGGILNAGISAKF